MALLHLVRDRAGLLKGSSQVRRWIASAALAVGLLAVAACQPGDSELSPDRRLQSELGLDLRDRVHEVLLSAGPARAAEPEETLVRPGDYLQFVTTDSWIHELIFEADSLAPGALAFMEELDQLASPPMVSRGSRFVVSFVEAPEGRYPYRVEGNRAPVRGVIVVATPPDR
ncbi:MAG: hypothetical protein WD995_04360 [Gemmatimonadota bacterium]